MIRIDDVRRTIAVLLSLCALLCVTMTGAAAQNIVCPDRPAADSSNACANTRFVKSQSVTPGGSSGQVQYNNGGALGGFTLGGDATLNTTTGVLTVTKTNGVAFGPAATGTRSGNTTVFATTSGTLTNGNCVKFDSAGNLVDAGAACSSATGIPSVDTLTALRALSAGAYATVYVLGHTTAGDGGGGPFIWIASSTATDNDGTIIRPGSAPATGRWIRQAQPGSVISAVWFGATCDGTDQHAAIQAALDAAALAGGGKVLLPMSTTACNVGTTGLTISDYTVLSGPGTRQLAQLTYSGTSRAIQITGDRAGLARMYITTTNAASDGVQIGPGILRWNTIEDVTIHSTTSGASTGRGLFFFKSTDGGYSGDFYGRSVFTLHFKYGWLATGVDATNTWTHMVCDNCAFNGYSPSPIVGSRGIIFSSLANGVGSGCYGCNVEANALSIEIQSGSLGLDFIGGDIEGNTVDAPSIPTSNLGTIANAWASFTPTWSCGTGSMTGQGGATAGKYHRFNKNAVIVSLYGNPTFSSCTGYMIGTLPYVANSAATCNGVNFSSSAALSVFASAGTSVLTITTYNGAFPTGSGQPFGITCTYEIQP